MQKIVTDTKIEDSKRNPHFEDILDVLIEKKWLIKPQADYLRNQSRALRKPLAKILSESKIIDEKRLLKAYSIYYNLPIIRLKNLYIPSMVIKRIPGKIAKKYYLIPFDEKNGLLKIAIAAPERLQIDKPGILSQIKNNQRVNISLYLTSKKDFQEALKNYYLSKSIEHIQNPTILDILIAQDLLSQEEAFEIQEKSKEEKKSFESIIREGGYVSAEELAKAQAFLYRIPYISLRSLKLNIEDIKKFPENIAREYNLVIFDTISDKFFKLATSIPEDPRIYEIIKFIKNRNNIDSHLYVTTPYDIEFVLAKYHESEATAEIPKWPKFSPKKEISSPVQRKEKEYSGGSEEIGRLDIGALLEKDIQSVDELKSIVKNEDIPKIVAAIINFSLVKKSSDIHIEPWADSLHIRYRIDGVLKDIIQIDKKLHPAIIARIKISAHLRLDEQRIPQDGRFDVNFQDRTVDIRVSTLPTSHGEKTVLRLLDKSQRILTLEDLGLTGRNYEIIAKDIKKPYGMVLATGPTGSGKTTTLYAILQSINTSQTNIVTLEDPIEYELDGINHCQVRADIGFSFAEGLRSILRQDPNVIMVGEIRDKETAGMAVHAALTGHLVLSTLHTNDASGAIPRLIDMEIESFLISSSVSSIIAQRLVRRICKKCKQKVGLPKEVMARVEKELAKIPSSVNIKIKKPLTFWRGKGCSNCEDGYSGRIGIFEVLPLAPEIQLLTVKEASSDEIKKKAIELGMLTMRQDGLLKALEGKTSVDEVFRVTSIAE